MTIWVVAADSTRARIFSTESAMGALNEIQDLLHPESRTRPRDMVSDRAGRQADSMGHSQHGVGGEHSEPKKEEADRFARELSKTLDEAGRSGRYQRLHVVAAPAFLGMLRKHLSDDTKSLIKSEVAANVATQKPADVRAQLPERL